MFCGETLLRGLSSTIEIWLKLCPCYLADRLDWVRKDFIVTRSSSHFSKHESQVYFTLVPTMWGGGVYIHHKKYILITLNLRISIGSFLYILFLH